MEAPSTSIINIGIVGGGELCREILQKTTFDNMKDGVDAPILAVADPDNQSPGILFAEEMGLLTFSDYHDLYDRRYSIHLIIILTPDPGVFDDILATRPPRIRIMSQHVFEIFWNAIGTEERKLREQKTAMETVLNGINDAILVLTPEMEIIDANDAFLKQSECSREAVIGRKCFEVHNHCPHQCNGLDITCPLRKVIRNQTHTQVVHTHQDANGRRRHMEITVYPVWEKSGKISKFIHISRDITQKMQEEAEITSQLEQMVEERTQQLRDTHLKMLHQDKMASLGKLSAAVVHEINNPIAGILNLIMLMKRVISEENHTQSDIPLFEKYLNLMETETRRISRIVSNLLAFSRQEKMEIGVMNINQLIDKILILSSNLLKVNRVKVVKRLSEDLPEMIGSEDQMQQVFMNLISNAAEAMEASSNGVLTITTEHLPTEGRIVVNISDTGPGIDREEYSNLFEPFFTTKKSGKGVGLGLSVVYGIVKEHGGHIYVESHRGAGTTFRVTLPTTTSNVNGGAHHGRDKDTHHR